MLKVRHLQRGSTLIIGLILLMVTTAVLITTHKFTSLSVDIVKNLQDENVVLDLANSTIEAAASSSRMFTTPNAVFLQACGGVANARCFDLNQDGTDDVVVELAPQPSCIRSQVLQNRNLDLNDPEQAACVISGLGAAGIQGASDQNSLCAASLWQVTARATDAVTSADQVVVADFAIQVPTDSVDTFCP